MKALAIILAGSLIATSALAIDSKSSHSAKSNAQVSELDQLSAHFRAIYKKVTSSRETLMEKDLSSKSAQREKIPLTQDEVLEDLWASKRAESPVALEDFQAMCMDDQVWIRAVAEEDSGCGDIEQIIDDVQSVQSAEDARFYEQHMIAAFRKAKVLEQRAVIQEALRALKALYPVKAAGVVSTKSGKSVQ